PHPIDVMPEKARGEARVPSAQSTTVGEPGSAKDAHLDLLEMILKKRPTTLEKWASGHKLGRTTVFDWKSCRSSNKPFKGKVSAEKIAGILKAIEDDAAELGLITRTDSD